VTLSAKATAAVTISFSTSNAAVPAPASVTIPAGSSTGSVILTSTAVANDVNVVIKAAAGSSSQSATLAVLAPRITAFTLNSSSVESGLNFTGAVTLNGPAPTGGLPLTLTTSSGAVKVPANASVPAGATKVTITYGTNQITTQATVTVTAKTVGAAFSNSITLVPIKIVSLTVSPTAVAALGTSKGTVTLSGPAPATGITVGLKSNASFISVPATVTVSPNLLTGTFTINTARVAATTSGTITATYANVPISATLTVNRTSDLSASSWPKFHGGANNQGVGAGSGANGSTSFVARPGLIPQANGVTVGSDGNGYASTSGGLFEFDTTGKPIWSAPGAMISNPVVDTSGNVYVIYRANFSKYLLRKYAHGGGLVWSVDVSDSESSIPGGVSLDATTGHVYFSLNSAIQAYDTNGNFLWANSDAQYYFGPTLQLNGNLCVLGSDAVMRSFSPSGSLVWQTDLGDAGTLATLSASLQVTSTGAIVFAGSLYENFNGTSRLYVLDENGVIQLYKDYSTLDTDSRIDMSFDCAPDGSIWVVANDVKGESGNSELDIFNADYSLRASLAIPDVPEFSITMTNDGGYLLTGGGSTACYNVDNSIRWVKTYGNVGYARGPGDLMLLGLGTELAIHQATGNIAWNIGSIESSPILGPDFVNYVGTDQGYLLSITKSVGVNWMISLNGAIHGAPVMDAAGILYVATAGGYLYAINSADGSQKWSLKIGSAMTVSPALGYDGAVFVGAANGRMYAVNPNGTSKWTFVAGSAINSSVALDSNGSVYFGTASGKFYCLTVAGAQQWTTTLGGAIDSSPTIGAANTVYIGCEDGKLYSLSSTGAVNWSYQTGAGIASSPALYTDGTICFGSDDFNVYALKSDGTLKWKYETNGFVRSSPAFASDGTVYVGSKDGNLYAISSAGSNTWRHAAGDSIMSSPAIDKNGKLYFGANDGWIYMLN